MFQEHLAFVILFKLLTVCDLVELVKNLNHQQQTATAGIGAVREEK